MFNNFPFHVCSEFFSENSSNGNRCENLMKIQKINKYIFIYFVSIFFVYVTWHQEGHGKIFPVTRDKNGIQGIFFFTFWFFKFCILWAKILKINALMQIWYKDCLVKPLCNDFPWTAGVCVWFSITIFGHTCRN